MTFLLREIANLAEVDGHLVKPDDDLAEADDFFYSLGAMTMVELLDELVAQSTAYNILEDQHQLRAPSRVTAKINSGWHSQLSTQPITKRPSPKTNHLTAQYRTRSKTKTPEPTLVNNN